MPLQHSSQKLNEKSSALTTSSPNHHHVNIMFPLHSIMSGFQCQVSSRKVLDNFHLRLPKIQALASTDHMNLSSSLLLELYFHDTITCCGRHQQSVYLRSLPRRVRAATMSTELSIGSRNPTTWRALRLWQRRGDGRVRQRAPAYQDQATTTLSQSANNPSSTIQQVDGYERRLNPSY
jgi:hypothetical protein